MDPTYWYWFFGILDGALALAASGYAVLNKSDPRAALGWIGFIWLAPFVGPICFFWLGVNRIERKAERRKVFAVVADLAHRIEDGFRADESRLDDGLGPLRKLVGEVTGRTLLEGNDVVPLRNGDEAYAQMLAAIDGAERSVALCTYIFDIDRAGRRFVESLAAAVERGVAVRVLVDDIGVRYSPERCTKVLAAAGVPVATFMPTMKPRWLHGANLRNHRKILVVDGVTGFTGGMNIREGHCLEIPSEHPIRDLHFKVRGPVVTHLQAVFASDWTFANGEVLEGETWYRDPTRVGRTVARGVPDGPDEDFDKIERVLMGALACARKSVVLVTPYFLPEGALVSALTTAALRGVTVDIVLPEKGNLPFVQWASTHKLPYVVAEGCRVWWSPPPFDHTKIMLVDDDWSFIGSANWDPRSLRLNFEFNIECYDAELAATLRGLADRQMEGAERVTLERLAERNLLVRLRDGLAHLATPYL